jgi:ribonuclease E
VVSSPRESDSPGANDGVELRSESDGGAGGPPGSFPGASNGGADTGLRRKRRRGRRGGRGRRGRGLAGEPGLQTSTGVAELAREGAVEPPALLVDEELDLDSPQDAPPQPLPRRGGATRGGRGGRGRREPIRNLPPEVGGDSELADAALPDALAEFPAAPADSAPRKRRRRGGRGRGRRGEREQGRAPARPARPQAPRALPVERPVEVEAIPFEDDDLPLAAEAEDLPELPDDAEMLHAAGGRPARGPRGAAEARPAPRAPVRRKNLILVNAADREEVRVAVVEDGQIVDFQMNVKRHESLVNDIYRGRVVNLEPAIGAAFVDFGEGRNGFLHTSDVLSVYGQKDFTLSKLLTVKIDPEDSEDTDDLDHDGHDGHGGQEGPDRGSGEESAPEGDRRAGRNGSRSRDGRAGRVRARPRLPITDLLEKGQSVVVQITKDAIGDKGPTLTTYISIPGRHLVLMPSMARTGVSRKIEDEKERRRLKRILQGLDNLPPGMGVIVRTAGVGCTREDLQRDLDYLMALWADFEKRLTLGRGPAPLYEESDVAIRTVRDLFSSSTEAVIVDEPEVYRRVQEFTKRLMPVEDHDRIQLHTGPKPLFHTYNCEQDFERIFSRRIELPSGGSVVFDQTEALVAIDVNSGKTRSGGFEFEEIALKTNQEAAAEIARQIRLRDLGGIIVCDFIDMQRQSSRRAIERSFRTALAQDRARSKLGRISQFGLLELTRQRLGPGLSRMLFHNCPRCRGSGRIRTVESRAGAILRRLGAALSQKGFSSIEVRTAPEVVEYLERTCAQELAELKQKNEREIALIPVTDQLEDSILRYLRQDGREVRPGGRRKR